MNRFPLLRSIAAAATVAGVLGLPAAARAAVTLDADGSFTTTVYHTGAFEDSFDFVYAGPSALIDFSFFSGGLDFDDMAALVITDSVSTHTYTEAALPFFDQQLSVTGPFTLSLAGLAATKGGYTLSVSATPAVPEPTTAALLLGGLAAVGFVATRRRGEG